MDFNCELTSRIRMLQGRLEVEGVRAMLVSGRENVLYLTGGETGRLLVTKDDALLFVKDLYKKLYIGLYDGRGYPLRVKVYGKDYVKKFVHKHRIKEVAVDNRSFASYDSLRKELKSRILIRNFVEEQRAVKSRHELALIKKSCGMASAGMMAARRVVRKGVREIEAVAEIEGVIRSLGSQTPPFNDGMLLASGRGSADIHAKAGSRKIARGLVVVDLGAKYGGYYSDMTRTLAVGGISCSERRVLEHVENLKDEVIDSIEPGASAGVVHRQVERSLWKIRQKFYHNAGHGVGLQVHESPNIGPDSKDILEPNMVFTIEPGVYIPGKFGVRFEDTVLLTGGGCRRLTC